MKQHIFYPGSEWLYLKIYTSFKHADKLLINNVTDFINCLIEKKLIDKWFFVRYADPESHLRLRLKLKPPFDFTTIFFEFSRIFENELRENSIWNINMDTYKRELKRYGDIGIDEAESIFHIDSECILNLLKSIAYKQDKENIRWLLGLSLIDSYFTAFSYNLNREIRLIKTISDSFLKEFGFFGAQHTKQLNNKYRKNRDIIKLSMDKKNIQIDVCYSIIEKHTVDITNVVSKIDLVLSDNLLTSLIHMSMNRLFLSDNRANELVIYYFASKFYSSEKARKDIY
jgi:thiopeptide-type bacteriocin biosynthesis protein